MSRLLEEYQKPMPISRYETGSRSSRCGSSFRNSSRDGRDELLLTINSFYNDEINYEIPEEKRTQKYLIRMITAYAICMFPLTCLSRLAKPMVTETYDNATHFDITYICFVWIGFLPTCITPAIYASWISPTATKNRFKNYFRFSYRKQRGQTSMEGSQVCEIEDRRTSCFSEIHSFDGTHRNSELIMRNCRDI